MTYDIEQDEWREQFESLRAQLERSRWLDPALRGGWPATEVVDALPAADEAYAYRIVTLRGDGSTTADATHQCLRDSAGVWGWRTVATG